MADEDQIQDFIDRLSSNPDLCNEFRETPGDVVERHGIELSDEQREKLEGEDWSGVSDEELVERLGRSGLGSFF